MNRWTDSAGGINYRPTSTDYGVPEPDQCPRCTFGLGEHSCWRREIQQSQPIFNRKNHGRKYHAD